MKTIKILGVVAVLFAAVLIFSNTGLADELIVTESGNVGIGTTSPRVTVDVPNNLDVQGGLYLGKRGVYNGTINTDDSLFINIDANNDQVNSRFQVGTNAPNSTGGATPLLTVIDNGNVGIGTPNPSSKITIYSPNNNSGDAIQIHGGSSSPSKYGVINVHDTDEYVRLGYYNGTAMKTIFLDGNVGIGTTSPTDKLDVAGYVKANGTRLTSDARYKENVEPLDNSLEKVTQLRGVSYDWIDKSRGEGRQIGVIAQEVEKVFPEVVGTDDKGYKSVEYSKLVAPLIEAVKELKKENDALKERIARLEALEQK